MQTNFEMKKSNTLKVFNTLKKTEYSSRKDLCRVTGLSWGSVSSITNELLDKHILIAAKKPSSGGRPAEVLTLNPSFCFLLGIDINSVGLNFTLINLQCKTVLSENVSIESSDKNELLSLLFNETKKILSQSKNVIAINLSMQGKINRDSGVSIRTNFFKNWNNVPLVDLFKNKFSIPTYLYHDPDCLLYYHMLHDSRLSDKKNGFVIRLDNGIGMARLLNGSLHNADATTSYEFGHIIAVPNGKPCLCGKKGCLETYASLRGMKQVYAENGGKSDLFLFKLKENEILAKNILKNAINLLGVSIANLFTLSSPEFILLYGAMLDISEDFFSDIKQVVKSNSNCGNLLLAKYEREAPAIGACLITLEKITENILFESTTQSN